jgi:hypothetical protein
MSNGPILIHVRFAPDGVVSEIGEKPAMISEQAWFRRGVFRLERTRLDARKVAALN